MMNAEITRIAAKSDGKLTFGFLLGLGIALWSANAGMKAMFDALNIIYDEGEKRGLIWLSTWFRCFLPSAPSPESDWLSHWWWCFRCFWPHSASRASIIRSSDICAGP